MEALRLQAQIAQAGAPSTTTTSNVTTLAVVPKDKIKLNQVVNQTNEKEVDILEASRLAVIYEIYRTRMGLYPSPEEECSAEQLTAFDAIVQSKSNVYVDFAVWTPFALRTLKATKLTGLRIGPDSTLIPVEVKGPEDFVSWSKCYALFRTAVIMFEVMSPAAADNYKRKIARYVEEVRRSMLGNCLPSRSTDSTRTS